MRTLRTVPRLTWYNLSAIVLFVMIVYSRSLLSGFIWDDYMHILNNPLLDSPGGLRDIWFSRKPIDYWPLTYTLLWLEKRIFADFAAGYHLTSILLHVLNTVLLCRILQKLRVRGAWAFSLIFAVHPINVQAVAWVFQQKTLLATLLAFASLDSCIAWYQNRQSRLYHRALLYFTLAMLAKSSVAAAPILLCAWFLLAKKESLSNSLRWSFPFFMVVAAVGGISLWFNLTRSVGDSSAVALDLASRFPNSGRIFWFYVSKILVPTNLCFVYPRWETSSRDLVGWLGLAAMLLWLAVPLLNRKWLSHTGWAGVFYFSTTLLPVLGFIDIYFLRYSYVADHYAYLSVPGIVVLGSGVLVHLLRNQPRVLVGITVGTTVLLSVLSWEAQAKFTDLEHLWTDTLRKNPNAYLALNNLGNIRVRQERYTDAIDLLRRAAHLAPSEMEVLHNLGQAYLGAGDLDSAEVYLTKAITVNDNAASRYSLGRVLEKRGLVRKAIENYLRGVDLDSTHTESMNQAGHLLFQEKRYGEAYELFAQSISIDPNNPKTHNNAGLAAYELGNYSKAVALFSKAIQLDPRYASAHFSLGNALFSMNDFDSALRSYKIATEVNPNYVDAWYNIGMVLIAENRGAEAADIFRFVVQRFPKYSNGYQGLQRALQLESQSGETDRSDGGR